MSFGNNETFYTKCVGSFSNLGKKNPTIEATIYRCFDASHLSSAQVRLSELHFMFQSYYHHHSKLPTSIPKKKKKIIPSPFFSSSLFLSHLPYKNK